MNEIEKNLENFGFSVNESHVYMAMLRCGEETVTKVAETAKLNRITVHHIVGRLEKRGFAVRFGKGREKLVSAAHPTRLQKKIHESSSEFDALLPKIVASMRDPKQTKKPVVRMYYGVEGFETAAEELLEKPNTTIRHIGSLAEAHKFIGLKYDLEHFIPTRLTKNIHYRALLHENEEKPLVWSTNAADLREVRYFPKGYSIPASTFIVPGKTITVTTNQELMTVVTESIDISESEIQKFDLLWDLLGPEAHSPH